ncbi:MAG: hypothetical protein H6R20_1574 [Proteobacteria bacterium]|jgi:hypothetical protein|nr:hypothetical protein [Pseudomonadota bacterium]
MTFEELKWPGVVLGLGLLLIIIEWRMASKKKGGVTFTDRQRMKGMAGVSVALAVLVYFLIWFA